MEVRQAEPTPSSKTATEQNTESVQIGRNISETNDSVARLRVDTNTSWAESMPAREVANIVREEESSDADCCDVSKSDSSIDSLRRNL